MGREYSGCTITRHFLLMNDIPPLAPLPRDQRNIDADHLDLLSIFYFVTAGLRFLGVFFLMGYSVLVNTIFANPAFWKNQNQAPPPAMLCGIVTIIFVIAGILCVVLGVLNLMAGLFLRQHKHRTFTLVVAALNCLQIPLGTVLGVFTIVVLVRPSVVQMYEAAERGQGVISSL